jgi:hypothetical protein
MCEIKEGDGNDLLVYELMMGAWVFGNLSGMKNGQ